MRPFRSSGGQGSRIDEMLDDLAQRDPSWERSALIARTRDIFVTYLLAQESGNVADAESCMMPEAVQPLEHQIGQWRSLGETIEYRNLCVRKVEITLVQPSAAKSDCSFTARISAHAERVLRRGQTVVQSDEFERPFVRFLSLSWAGNDWKLHQMSAEAGGRL